MLIEMLEDPSYWPSVAIAFVIVGSVLFRIGRIFFREGVIQHIKDDWTYRLPYRIRHNRYRGLSRPSYVLICLVYYPLKALFLLVVAFEVYFIKFLVWDLWKWLFRHLAREWDKKKEERMRIQYGCHGDECYLECDHSAVVYRK